MVPLHLQDKLWGLGDEYNLGKQMKVCATKTTIKRKNKLKRTPSE